MFLTKLTANLSHFCVRCTFHTLFLYFFKYYILIYFAFRSICTTFDLWSRYFRSKKLKYYLAFCSLIRTFAR